MSNGEERLKNLSREEVSRLRKDGYEIVYITGKNYYLFYFNLYSNYFRRY